MRAIAGGWGLPGVITAATPVDSRLIWLGWISYSWPRVMLPLPVIAGPSSPPPVWWVATQAARVPAMSV
jgi:hypothetical protein